jgi:galactitol-specific phosphotransferase system IIB component
MKRSFWKDLGGHSEESTFSIGNLDWDFWLTATRHGFTPSHTPVPLYLYRIHGVSTSSTRARYDYLTRECMLERHKSLFEKYGTEKEFIVQGYCNALASCLRVQDWNAAVDVWKKARKRDIPRTRLIKTCLRYFKEATRNTPVIRPIWPHLKIAKMLVKNINSLAFSKLYNHPLVQKKYWSRRGHDLYTRYGNSEGGFETLSKVFDNFNPKIILEIGCGNGRNFSLYEKRGAKEIVGQDISKSAVQYATQRNIPNAKIFECQINELPYDPKHFDIVVCNRVLQHIPPKHIKHTIENAVNFSNIIYTNELSNEEVRENNIKKIGPDTFIHDYTTLFNSAGASLECEYIENGQRRKVYRVKK